MCRCFLSCVRKKTHQEETLVNFRIECWGRPPGSNLNKGKDWPPECNYSSTLRAEVICYVTEKPMPSPTETESYLTVICSRCIVNRLLQEIWRASQHILSRTESVSKHYAERNRGESGRHDGTCRLRLGMKNIYI